MDKKCAYLATCRRPCVEGTSVCAVHTAVGKKQEQDRASLQGGKFDELRCTLCRNRRRRAGGEMCAVCIALTTETNDPDETRLRDICAALARTEEALNSLR